MINELKELKRINGNRFVFSADGGATPIVRYTMYNHFYKALLNIGMSEDEISERHLHLHAWRHFLNTELINGGLTIQLKSEKSVKSTEAWRRGNVIKFRNMTN
jgi:integrase